MDKWRTLLTLLNNHAQNPKLLFFEKFLDYVGNITEKKQYSYNLKKIAGVNNSQWLAQIVDGSIFLLICDRRGDCKSP